jgi:TonB family protein
LEAELMRFRVKTSRASAGLACLLAALVGAKLLAAQDSNPAAHTDPSKAAKGPTPSTAEVQPEAGGIEILNDTEGIDFGPYLQRVFVDVREKWYKLIPYIATAKKGKLAIEFAIQQDGQVASMRLVATSGDTSLDRAARDGIMGAAPFPRLPKEFAGDRLTLRFRFYYYPDKADLEEVSASASAPAVSPSSPSAAKASTRVSILEVIGAAQDADLGPYLETSVLPLVRAHWYRLATRSPRKEGGQLTVEFTILKDGAVASVRQVDPASHAALGDLSIQAVEKSEPFPALPAGFSGQQLAVRVRFEYDPGMTPRTTEPQKH